MTAGKQFEEAFWQNEFKQFTASIFPSLPSPSFQPSATEKVTRHISLNHGSAPKGAAGSIPTVLAISWGLVLSSYAGSNDVLFGLAPELAGRDCDSPIPFRLQIGPQQTVEDALENEGIRIQRLAAAWDSAFTDRIQPFLGQKARQFQLTTLWITREPREVTATSDNALAVICDVRKQGEIELEATFDPNLITAYTASMMLHQLAFGFQELLQPSRYYTPLEELKMISPEGWNDIVKKRASPPPPRKDICIHKKITSWCQAQPLSPAIIAWDGQLTYQELDGLSTRLALRIANDKVLHLEQLVCVLIEKSVWVSVAILAILKAGGAILLLDASQPLERLRKIRQKAQSPLVLSSSKHLDMANQLDTAVLHVPESIPPVDTSTDQALPAVQSQHAAYSLFTSGSTGEPKAAVIEHGAFSTGWDTPVTSRLGLGSSSRVFQFASHAFAISLTDYLGTLLQGGCVCVPAEDQLQNDMAGAIETMQANWSVMTPSMARTLEPDQVPSLGTLTLSGEPMTTADVEQWSGRLQLLSLYGQCESAVGALIFGKTGPPQDHNSWSRGAVSPVYHAWVVHQDNHDCLMPLGAVGELLLDGPCVGRGYLSDPVQTADKFIHNPAWLHRLRPGSASNKLLKTGDLVRMSEDGSLEYLGRKGAAEVKLRGQRMNLTEVEYHLQRQYPKSRVTADVIVPSDDTGSGQNAMLAAFVVAELPIKGEDPGDESSIFIQPIADSRMKANAAISCMKQSLPGYMVPTVIINVKSLPLTASGKLHKQHLRQCASSLSRKTLLAYMKESNINDSKTHAVTPEGFIIQKACADSLGVAVETIGIEDNYSSLGGDSLGARRMVSICRKQGLTLTVADVLSTGSLEALASHCARNMDEEAKGAGGLETDPFAQLKMDFLQDQPALVFDAAEIEDVFPLQGAQTLEKNDVSHFAFGISGHLDSKQLRLAWHVLVQKHPPLRTTLVPFRGRFVNVVLSEKLEPKFTHEILPAGTDLVAWAASWSREGMKHPPTSNEPVAHFILGQNDEKDPNYSVFIMRLSHAHYDGNCLTQLETNLWQAYQGKPVTVESNYGDFARDALRQFRNQDIGAYWRGLLAGTDPMPLPVSQKKEQMEEAQSLIVKKHVDVSTSLPFGIPIATVVKAAWADVVRRRMKSSNIVLSQVINTRDVVSTRGAEQIFGACHAFVPLCVRFSPGATIRDLLQSIQNQYVASLPRAVISWDDLVANYTSWPSATNVGFMLSYQDFPSFSDQLRPVAGGKLLSQCTSRMLGPAPPGEAWVLVEPDKEKGRLTLKYILPDTVMCKEEAEEWLGDFGETIVYFLTHTDAVLDDGTL